MDKQSTETKKNVLPQPISEAVSNLRQMVYEFDGMMMALREFYDHEDLEAYYQMCNLQRLSRLMKTEIDELDGQCDAYRSYPKGGNHAEPA